jgi:hypothetical protein
MSSLNKLWERNDPLVCQLKNAVKKDDPHLIPDGISAKRMIRPFRIQESELCLTSYNILEESSPVPTRVLDWVFDKCDDRYLYIICLEQLAFRQETNTNNYIGSLYFARGAGYLLCKLLDKVRFPGTPEASSVMAIWSATERAAAKMAAAKRRKAWDVFWEETLGKIEERQYTASMEAHRIALYDRERRLERKNKCLSDDEIAENKRIAIMQMYPLG